MPRTSRTPRIINRTVRARLAPRRDPYWHLIAEGQHLGYRKTGQDNGTWIARYYTRENGRRFQALGHADDTTSTNGTHVLAFVEAQKRAQDWFAALARADQGGVRIGKYTVASAAQDWLSKWDGTGQSKITSAGNVKNHILPTLGNIEIARLTRKDVETWLHHVANKPPMKSTMKKSRAAFDPADPNVKRMRRESANRVFRDLKALLNAAYRNQHVVSPAAWETVPEFKNVSIRKTDGVLTIEEAVRVLDACEPDFRNVVYAALTTGCRYGEVCNMKAGHYNRDLNAITVLQGKTGKPKHVYLTLEEAEFFNKHTDGKKEDAPLLLRADGKPWGKSNQQQRIADALKVAAIKRHVRFHDLRHTFGSLLANRGVPMEIIQKQLGHSSVRVTEQFYVHFSPTYIAAGVRANKPSFGPSSKPKSSDEVL